MEVHVNAKETVFSFLLEERFSGTFYEEKKMRFVTSFERWWFLGVRYVLSVRVVERMN